MTAPKPLGRLGLAKPPLSATDRIVLGLCMKLAKAGEKITQDAIRQAIGSGNFCGSTSTGILNRLETGGYIERIKYQRGVVVCVDGVCTAAPSNTAPHWRDRPPTEKAPTPAIHRVAERCQSLAAHIETRAKRNGISQTEQMLNMLWVAKNVIEQSEGEWGDV